MKKVLSNKFLLYHLPLTLILFSFFTMEKSVIPFDGGSDRLYGFPFSYKTGNLGCTGCYEVYIAPMTIDLLIYFVVIAIILKSLEKSGLKLRTHWAVGLASLAISSLFIYFFFAVPDSLSYRFYNDTPYKTISKKLI
ncbi:hypothetical protein [Mucilaginibacter sp. FT3.2]|uniref:hypothetical protein n=1 Tax=Mucilaginibacter sp. FT3.2 TaxID=2723090 RepID=UPI0016123C07|nr:hypothetical protein [Mucilaginibacter sp. FT3.2]MBB6233056.1 hypothetical protein [Mucilaginibacter sp. FT3.2]